MNIAFDVLDSIMCRRVHEYLDERGRPLGEGRSKAFQQVKTEMRACPYAGSRQNHAKPMNISALQQMPPWRNLLTMLSWLNQRYCSAVPREMLTSDDLANVTSGGIFLADFLALRRQGPLASGEFPLIVSGLYKICLGFQLAYLPERFLEDAELTVLPDSQGFQAYLEENELLIGEVEVCSGTPAMITQAYEAIVNREPITNELLPTSCVNLGIDWDRFDSFRRHASCVWRELVIYAIKSLDLRPQLINEHIPAAVRENVSACIKQQSADAGTREGTLVVDLAKAVIAERHPAAVINCIDSADESVKIQELRSAVARYREYQVRMLDSVNSSVRTMLHALGIETCEDSLTLRDIDLICGFASLEGCG